MKLDASDCDVTSADTVIIWLQMSNSWLSLNNLCRNASSTLVTFGEERTV